MYRVLVAHANNETGAAQVRQYILEQHPRIHSCHITEAGPALGRTFRARLSDRRIYTADRKTRLILRKRPRLDLRYSDTDD